MLYEVDQSKKSLKSVQSSWSPKELDIEKYIITRDDSGAQVLAEEVFGEPLLLISNQVRTRNKKRADILALDRAGNGVVIELKRDKGQLGVETQALQYLADFSSYTGENFLKKFSKKDHPTQDDILGFVGDNAEKENLNRNSRVILMARSFDSSLFSMGEWLSGKGVSFRCVTYMPVELAERKLLSFSVVFDRATDSLFPLSFSDYSREPGFYWHNIAHSDEDWWNFLVEKQQIPTSFQNIEDDQGEKILKKYVPGDTIIAYARGFGAIGWGVIPNPPKYKLLDLGDDEDFLNGDCRHRLGIKWKLVAKKLSDGITPDIIRNEFGIYHPVSTSVSIDPDKCRRLIKYMNEELQK